MKKAKGYLETLRPPLAAELKAHPKTDPADTDRAIAWTREFWDEMRQGTSGGVYLNFVVDGVDNEEMMRASYGGANYDRLVEVKTKYDPTNMFRLNQNIPPSGA